MDLLEGKNVVILSGVGIIVALVIGLVLGGSLAPSQSDVVVIRFAGWGAGATEIENYENMIGNFSRDNPGIRIEYEIITNQLHENILGSFGAGQAPDIFYMDSQWAPVFMDSGVLYPVNELATEAELAEYKPELLTPFTDSAGDVFGIPKDWSMLSLFYNKDLLTSAGWTDPPDTWAELRQAAIDITDSTSANGLVLNVGDFNRFVSTATSNGASSPWFTSAADASWFDSSAVQDSLNYYIDLFRDGRKDKADASEKQWLVSASDVSAGWIGEAFGAESVGLAISGSWAVPYLDGTFPDFVYGTDWGIAPMPQGSSGRSTMAYTVALGMNKDTENPEAAWKFLRYITDKAGQTQLVVQAGQTLPSIQGLDDHEDMWPQHIAELATEYDTTTVFTWGVKGSTLESAFSVIMVSAMNKEITVATAITEMKAAVVDAFA